MKPAACREIPEHAGLAAFLPAEIRERRLGCANAVPEALLGATVVDLGCGAGADCFIAAQLVGPRGEVIGVDISDELVGVANAHAPAFVKDLGHPQQNLRFVAGRFEEVPLAGGSADVVIANCAISLAAEKERVFAEAWRLLKDGGELYFADMISDRRLPARMLRDERLQLDCLAGASYLADLRRSLRLAGFSDVRVVARRPLEERVDDVRFEAVTLRAFKLRLDETQEDYGQIAIYDGTIERCEEVIGFDVEHRFEAGRALRLSKNTADMLRGSRFSRYFSVSEEVEHLGQFQQSRSFSDTGEPSRARRRSEEEPGGPTELELEPEPSGEGELELGDWPTGAERS